MIRLPAIDAPQSALTAQSFAPSRQPLVDDDVALSPMENDESQQSLSLVAQRGTVTSDDGLGVELRAREAGLVDAERAADDRRKATRILARNGREGTIPRSSPNAMTPPPDAHGTCGPHNPYFNDVLESDLRALSVTPYHKSSQGPRGLVGRKARRRLQHPLQEERSLFDVWPAFSDKDLARPQLLLDIVDALQSKLQKLAAHYPEWGKALRNVMPRELESEVVLKRPAFAGENQTLSPLNMPNKTMLNAPSVLSPTPMGRKSNLRPVMRSPPQAKSPGISAVTPVIKGTSHGTTANAPPHPTPLPRLTFHDDDESLETEGHQRSSLGHAVPSAEDVFHTTRVSLFEASLMSFAGHFRSYRRFLLWVLAEFRSFHEYCHKHVVSPEMRKRFEEQVRDDLRREFHDTIARLEFDCAQWKQKCEEAQEKLVAIKRSTQATQQAVAEREYIIAEKEREIEQNAIGRAALLNRISRLESDLWAQRDSLAGPEATIANLRREIRNHEERYQLLSTSLQEANTDRALLKARLERLEMSIRERRTRQGGTVPRSELLAIKKYHIDTLEQNAVLEGKIAKLRVTARSLLEDLQRVRQGAPGTPRPPWHLADEFFPQAATTAQRFHLAMKEYRLMVDRSNTMSLQIERLKELLSMQPREDSNAESAYVVPQMLSRYFFKLGFEAHVPAFLKGTGKALNLKFSRDKTEGLCRALFVHRMHAKSNTPIDALMDSFIEKYTPENYKTQDFAYSFYYATQWYSFDYFVGLMRRFIKGDIDEMVLTQLVEMVDKCKTFVFNLLPNAEAQEIDTARSDSTSASKEDSTTTLDKTELVARLADYFANKEVELIKRLIGKINADCPTATVDVVALFKYHVRDRRFSYFVEELLHQAIVERNELEAEYIESIQELSPTSETVHPNDVAKRIWDVDPLMPVSMMDELIADVFETTIDDLSPGEKEETMYPSPGLVGERVYECSANLCSDEYSVVERIRRRHLIRFCPVSAREDERDRVEREAERRREKRLADMASAGKL
jgi:hypothetical protein